MGLGLPKSVLVEPQLFVVRAIDAQQHLEKYYQRYYINMDRQQFDRWLLSMVPQGVKIRLGCSFRSYETRKNGFKLNLIEENRPCAEYAKILVAADGATSRVRKQAVPHHPFPKAYLAIQQWLEADSQLPYFSTIFDPEVTDYYGWTIPKGNCLVIGAALHPRFRISAKFALFKNRLRDFGFRFGKTIRRESAFILRPAKTHQISTGKNGIVLLGEAAGWVSPSSAEGYSYAFESAMILAQVLRRTPEQLQTRFHQKTIHLTRKIFLKTLKAHFIYNPSLRNTVMRTGIRSMKVYRS